MTMGIRSLSFATGQPHPLAERPVIVIDSNKFFNSLFDVLIEIVGEFLVLLITYQSGLDECEDMFFLVR